jgi:branched-subunit amino acid ABC-type transport system permease component
VSAIAQVAQGVLVDTAILGVASVGFSLQFGVTGYVNFAYAQLVTFGAFTMYAFNVTLGQNFVVSLLAAGVCVALLSLVLGVGIYGPFFKRRPQVLYVLVVSFAMNLGLNDVWVLIWGSNFYQLRSLQSPTPYSIGPFSLTAAQLFAIGLAAVVLTSVWLLLRYTRLGKSMRAVADNRSLANIAGIRTGRIIASTWLITGFLAGLAGVLQAQLVSSFDVTLGTIFLWLIIAATIVGGLGRAWAPLAGALVIAFLEQAGVYVVGSSLAPAAAFIVLIPILLWRPSGILGGRTTLENA